MPIMVTMMVYANIDFKNQRNDIFIYGSNSCWWLFAKKKKIIFSLVMQVFYEKVSLIILDGFEILFTHLKTSR